jgi:hypothetical protein
MFHIRSHADGGIIYLTKEAQALDRQLRQAGATLDPFDVAVTSEMRLAGANALWAAEEAEAYSSEEKAEAVYRAMAPLDGLSRWGRPSNPSRRFPAKSTC